MNFVGLSLGLLLAGLSGQSLADDWHAVRLRGTVLELDNGAWSRLKRGDVVSDDRIIKTLNGKVTFQRGQEILDVAANSMIQIMDRDGRSYTTVVNHEGGIALDVEAKNVYHFSVVTPHLAAVVKGTAFSVETGRNSSSLAVTRGEVLVEDSAHDQQMTVSSGQAVETGSAPAQVVPIEVVMPPAAPSVAAPQSLSSGDSSASLALSTPSVLASGAAPAIVAEQQTIPNGPQLGTTFPAVVPIEPPILPIIIPIVTPIIPVIPIIPPIIVPTPDCEDDDGDDNDCDDD